MAERKQQMGNVAFGGNWSEEILYREELRVILDVIDRAAFECGDRDVEDEELLSAMLYVRKNIEKGPMLSGAFFKALRLHDRQHRLAEVQRVVGLIHNWAGF